MLLLLSFLFACGEAKDPVEPGPSGRLVEVGTGADRFQPITAGERLPLVMAPQIGMPGATGFHYDVSVRARGFTPEGTLLVTVVRRDDGIEVGCLEQDVRLTKRGDDQLAVGLRAVVTSCGELANRDLTLRAELTDLNGATGADERQIVGPELCPR